MSINNKSNGRYVRINRHITAPVVRVKNYGIMGIIQACELAYQEGLDLVEIAPHANPPVCEIMDFGKWQFDAKKREKESLSKQKINKPKEIRLRPVCGEHDVDIKIKQLKKFLEEKLTVYVNMKFKNRELVHKEQGKLIIDKVIREVEEIGKTEQPPRFEGSTLTVRFVPK